MMGKYADRLEAQPWYEDTYIHGATALNIMDEADAEIEAKDTEIAELRSIVLKNANSLINLHTKALKLADAVIEHHIAEFEECYHCGRTVGQIESYGHMTDCPVNLARELKEQSRESE